MDSIGSNDGMLCEICGQKYHTVWKAIDKLWVKVTGATEQEDAPGYFSGLWCPHCFSKVARAKGITLRWCCGDEVWPDVPEQIVRQSEYIVQQQAALEKITAERDEALAQVEQLRLEHKEALYAMRR